MNLEPEQTISPRKAGIFFVGIGVYLNFFQRFYEGVEKNFIPDVQKVYFIFTDNHLKSIPSNVQVIKVPFSDPWFTKLHKFHFISSVLERTKECDWLFYFDADSTVDSLITCKTVTNWFSDDHKLVGVLHPWRHIRNKEKRFEQNPISAAYIPRDEFHLMDYHQSCFWGGTTSAVSSMAFTIRDMVDSDLAINHINHFNICDEIYVNRYFFSNLHQLYSLDTEYANPGPAYEKATSTPRKPGYRFPGEIKVAHDNAAQTHSWRQLESSMTHFTHGAYAQFFKNDLAAYRTLESYRKHNPEAPIVLISDGGDDLSVLADTFSCHYVNDPYKAGTAQSPQNTNQYERLKRIRKLCDEHLKAVDWIVILEPDLECIKSPSVIPRYALSGLGQGQAWSEKLKKMFEARNPKRRRSLGLGYNYTDCGGAIFNRECFAACFDQTSLEDFCQATNLDSRIGTDEDASMCFLFQFNGFDTGEWEDLTDWTKVNKSQFAFVHGNKQFYGKPSPSN